MTRWLPLLLLCSLAHGQGLFFQLLSEVEPPDGGTIDSPTNIADLAIFHEPDSLDGPPEGTTTNTWQDVTANDWDATQSTAAARPYLTNSVVDSWRGLYFDGSDDYMTWPLAALPMTRNRPGLTVFMLVSRITSATDKYLLFIAKGTAPSTAARAGVSTSLSDAALIRGVARREDGDSAVGSDEVGFPSGPVLIAAKFDWANGAFKMWTNGVLAIDDTTMTSAGNTSDTDALGQRLAGSNSAGKWFGGVIVTFLCYSNSVSDSDISGLTSGYFKTKYPGLNLP